MRARRHTRTPQPELSKSTSDFSLELLELASNTSDCSAKEILKRALNCGTSWEEDLINERIGRQGEVLSLDEVETKRQSLPNLSSPSSRTDRDSKRRQNPSSELLASQRAGAMERTHSQLLVRLKDYEQRGLISADVHSHYKALLRSQSTTDSIQQINAALDQVTNHVKTKLGRSVLTDAQNTVVSGGTARRQSARSSIEDGQGEQKVLIEPHDLWNGSVKMFDEKQLQDLFVEMCFFARLGYVQPPSCLKCAYKQSMSKDKACACKGWVVWRKDATTSLHPNRIDGNIVIVQCEQARKLLKGSTVDGCTWDPDQKLLISL